MLAEKFKQMICFKCGFQNPSEAKFCQKCQTVLPKISEELYEAEPRITGRIDTIRNACDQARSGAISLEEFSEFLTRVSMELAQKTNEIVETVESGNYFKDAPEEVEAGFKGIEFYEQGLAKMLLFLGEGDLAFLDEGLDLITQGNDFINQAMRLNRDARRNLDWDIWA